MNTRILLSIFIVNCFLFEIYSLDLEKIRADILTNHNYHRKRHQVGNLVRNSEIEQVAQSYSEYQASIDSMIHSENPNYGENLYSCWSSSGICVTGEKASQKWYDEVSLYDFKNPGYTPGVGHFTQLVWKGSNQIGCGVACNSFNNCYLTCNYYPSGNYLGQFQNNVFPLKGDDEDDEDEDGGMSTAGKVFLAIFIILMVFIIAFAVFHFVIKKKTFSDIKYYFIKSSY